MRSLADKSRRVWPPESFNLHFTSYACQDLRDTDKIIAISSNEINVLSFSYYFIFNNFGNLPYYT